MFPKTRCQVPIYIVLFVYMVRVLSRFLFRVLSRVPCWMWYLVLFVINHFFIHLRFKSMSQYPIFCPPLCGPDYGYLFVPFCGSKLIILFAVSWLWRWVLFLIHMVLILRPLNICCQGPIFFVLVVYMILVLFWYSWVVFNFWFSFCCDRWFYSYLKRFWFLIIPWNSVLSSLTEFDFSSWPSFLVLMWFFFYSTPHHYTHRPVTRRLRWGVGAKCSWGVRPGSNGRPLCAVLRRARFPGTGPRKGGRFWRRYGQVCWRG